MVRGLTALAWVAIVGASACYRPEPAACAITCNDGTECPSGATCEPDRYCHAPGVGPSVCSGADASPGTGDGASSDAFQGYVAAPCAPAAGSYGSTFDLDGALPTGLHEYVEPGTGLVIANGFMTLTPIATGSETLAYARIESDPFTFQSRRFYMQIQQMVDLSAQYTSVFLGVYVDTTHQLMLVESNGNLIPTFTDGGANVLDSSRRPADPAQDRWWQVREQDGRVYFETSPNGTDWTELADAATPTWASTMFGVGAGTWNYTPIAPGSLVLDQIGDCPP